MSVLLPFVTFLSLFLTKEASLSFIVACLKAAERLFNVLCCIGGALFYSYFVFILSTVYISYKEK